MLDHDSITQQLDLLATYRRTLAHLLEQAAQYGGEVFAPPQTANGIAEARKEIRRIKRALREGGVEVEDESSDDAPPAATVTHGGEPAPAGPRVQSTLNVTENTGTVIGTQIINQPSLTPALHQLRAPIGDFVGRSDEMNRLVSGLSKGGAAATISGVRGMGGIGKTELAYAAAQQLAAQYPDAQFLVELRGASSSPLTPEQALQTIIRAFERESKLPDDLMELQALYRDKLTGKRVLILADDAKDAAQVRPLLPPAGCALLVTSRTHFSLPGMAALDLGTLPPEEAEQLLREVCPRIGEQASALAKLCGYLPLALRVSASVLANDLTRGVNDYLERLSDERTRLAHLRDPDDPSLNVDASLALSYDALESAAQTALCHLSVFAASFDVAAAQAVLADAPDDVAMPVENAPDTLLSALYRRSLLDYDTAQERYSLHELVRAFATTRLDDEPPLRLRYARHYAQIAGRADELYLHGGEQTLAGLTLFDRERVHIDAGWRWARERAGEADADALLLDYANATVSVGDLRYDVRRERIPQLDAALEAARRLGRKEMEGAALGNLGIAYAALGEVRHAMEYYEQALAVARELGDRRGEGNALGNLGLAYANLGEVRRAMEYHEQALAVARELGDRHGEGSTLGNLGNAYMALGEVRRAIAFHEQALLIDHEIGDRQGEGADLGNLGSAYYSLGDVRRAIAFYEQRLTIAREIGDRQGEGAALGNLGNAYAALGDARRAIAFHEQALLIDREIGDRQGEGVGLGNLGRAYAALGDARQAIAFYEQRLTIAREISDRQGEGAGLGNLGLAYAALGDARQAIAFYEQRLTIAREISDRQGEGAGLGNLGSAYADLGDARQAIAFYEQQLLIVREIGDRQGEAIASWNLGLALGRQGEMARAIALMQVYVDFLSDLGHPDVEKRVAELDQFRQWLAARDTPAERRPSWWRRLIGRG